MNDNLKTFHTTEEAQVGFREELRDIERKVNKVILMY
jgi:hypothetical protein